MTCAVMDAARKLAAPRLPEKNVTHTTYTKPRNPLNHAHHGTTNISYNNYL